MPSLAPTSAKANTRPSGSAKVSPPPSRATSHSNVSKPFTEHCAGSACATPAHSPQIRAEPITRDFILPPQQKGRADCPPVILPRQRLVCRALWIDRVGAQAPDLVGFIVGKIAFEPFHMAVAFKRQHMGGQPVEEHPVM